jgi:hypothetical protein
MTAPAEFLPLAREAARAAASVLLTERPLVIAERWTRRNYTRDERKAAGQAIRSPARMGVSMVLSCGARGHTQRSL